MNTVWKRLKSKTYIYGLGMMVLAYVQTNLPMLEKFFGENYSAVMFVFGLGVLIFRELTNQPLSEK